ncbi:MAG: sigma-54-dependent Fis family transcriptional regulator [Deltaproteobacteria bacterium]|nr:sigma-54-dependent Fis family transcriptional regulator [Deltaproteobacteria bacterium]
MADAIRTLVIEDDESMREVLAWQVGEVAGEVDTAADGEKGLKLYDPAVHRLVITDLRMPKKDGMTVLREILKRDPDAMVIVVSAFGDVPIAVEAMKAGAYDFILKPFDREHLQTVVKKALKVTSLRRRVEDLEQRLDQGGKTLVYASAAMSEVVRMVDLIADSDIPVLITGESGTGKELLARRLHSRSGRRDGPYVAINCGAIPRDLIESELFGHARGAFTGAVKDRKGRFEQANGGTLLLDEVGELPLELQPKLLRVLEEGRVNVLGREKTVPVDVRVLAATNRDLAAEAAAGRFRSDLYFRLNVIEVHVPPLRERTEDVSALALHFLKKWGQGRDLTVKPDAMAMLEGAQWPGNVRELENACRRFALLADKGVVTMEMAAQAVGTSVAMKRESVGLVMPEDGLSLRDLEKEAVLKALKVNRFNQSKAARFLRIPRHVLLYRMKKYGISKGVSAGEGEQ